MSGLSMPKRLARGARWGTALAVLAVVLVLGWAVMPGLFAPGDPLAGTPVERFTSPGASSLLGTDYVGRDLYTRIVHGTSLSLRSAALAVGLGMAGGTLLGVLAGLSGGVIDAIAMRLVDVLLAVPSLLVSLLVVTVLEFNAVSVAIAVGAGSVAGFARLARAETLRVRGFAFIESARASGLGRTSVAVRHLLPNIARPLLAFATLEFAGAILAISALTFLGFGAQPPTPEWGALVSDGRNYLTSAWWLTVVPGLVIMLTVISVNTIGRALRDR